jgi:phosphotransferase family enzyme
VTRELDALVRWFQQRHGDAIGIRPDSSYRAVRLDKPGDTSQRHCIRFAHEPGAVPRLVLLKRYGPEHGRADVASELCALRLAHTTLGTEGASRAPAPYACHPEERALFMEYCPGVPLSRALFGALRWSRVASTSSGRARLPELAGAAGELLRRLQGASVADLGSPATRTSAEILRGYDARLRGLLDQWEVLGLPAALARRVGEYVSGRLDVSAEDDAIVFQHSDFGPWNLLFAPGVLYATDFHTSRPGRAEYDAAFFATALDSLLRYRTVDPALVGEMRSAFLRRASALGTELTQRPRFQAFRAMHGVYLALTLLERRVPPHERLYWPRPRRPFAVDWLESLVRAN